METVKAEILNFAEALKLCTFYEKLKQRKVDRVAHDRLRVLYQFKEIDGVWQLTAPGYDFASQSRTKNGFTAFANNGGKIYSREAQAARGSVTQNEYIVPEDMPGAKFEHGVWVMPGAVKCTWNPAGKKNKP